MKTSYCFKKLFFYMRSNLPALLLGLLFTLISVGSALLIPVFIGRTINYIVGVGNVDFDNTMRHIIYIALCIPTYFIFGWLATVLTNRVAFKTVCSLRVAAFNKLNSVPLSYIDSNSHGDIMSRIVSDTDTVSDGLINGFSTVFSGIMTIAGTIGLMLALHTFIALLVIILTPLSILVSFFIAHMSREKFRLQSKRRGELAGLTEEMLSGQKIVKAFSYEQTAQQRFDKINSELKDCGILAMFYSSLSNPAARFVNGIVYAAVAVTGAITAINNPLVFSVGALVSFLAYANQYSKPFTEVTGVLTELQSSLASLRRVIEILDAEQESDEKNLPSLKECNGDLKAENVCFSYDKSRPLIKNFNINIKKGMRVAIVGPTGCGKTTLINLLMRFYDIDSGRIAVWDKSDIPDGNDMPVDIKEVTRSSLRSHYGMVLQDTWLFKGTIKDNIAYGKQDATLEEITEAAKKSHIHGFISRLEHGYDTMLTEDGAPLSQGQKQLLTIARIMLTRPPMLILDEATSNIDTRTELHIQNAFKTMMKGRTSFIIAHRLSTIEDADLILVMNNGNIIESGTHKQLLTKGGFYANLFNSQFSV